LHRGPPLQDAVDEVLIDATLSRLFVARRPFCAVGLGFMENMGQLGMLELFFGQSQ
jgi:hypothetical protein